MKIKSVYFIILILLPVIAYGTHPLPVTSIPAQLDGKVIDGSGKSVSEMQLESYDYFLFYVSASHCSSCKPHTEALKEFYRSYSSANNKKEKVAFILIGRDFDESTHHEYLKKNRFPFYTCWWKDIVNLRTHYQAFWHWRGGTPHFYLLDKKGNSILSQFDRETRKSAKTRDIFLRIRDFIEQQ